MKILIFNWRDIKHSWAGGAEISIFKQAAYWVRAGHDITVFCAEDFYKRLPSYEVIRDIKVYRKGGRFSVYLWAIWYYLSRFRGDVDVVVDVENGIPFFTPLFCRTAKICFVYHVHNRQFFYELDFPLNYIGYFIERFIFPLLYRNIPVIAISETTKKELVRIGFKKRHIRVIYCGIEKPTSMRKNTIRKFSQPTILYLGRIKAYKRIDLLVTLFPKIIETVPNARLLIAGWGTEASYVTDLVMRSPLRKRIRLIGPVNEIEKKQLLSRAWIFVNPSIGEGWSIAIIEANLHGTPAIAFHVNGLSEVIREGKTGLLAYDEEDFIDKICMLLSNKSLTEMLGKNAREWAMKFDWEETAKKSLHFLHKLIEKKEKIH